MIFKSYLVEENIEVLKNNFTLFYGENLGLQDDIKKNIIRLEKKNLVLRYTQEQLIYNENILYDELDNEQGYHSVYYTDNACRNPVTVLTNNPIGFSMVFTKVKGVTDTAIIATNQNGVFVAAVGTEFSETAESYFSKSDDVCSSTDYPASGSVHIPVEEMTEDSHGLKFSYTSIRLEGYQTN